MKRLTTQEFIEKAKKIHGERYDYSKTEYVKSNQKVCIICPIHGEFWQTANDHLRGKGCILCAKTYKSNTEEFIEKARKVHGDKYDYSEVEYISTYKKVKIICPVHGAFMQAASSHLSGSGCPHCYGNVKKTTEQYIEEALNVHNGRYSYENTIYNGNHHKIKITCPIHGEFEQEAIAHLKGQGCPLCNSEKKNLTEFKIKETLTKLGINFEYQKRFEWLGLQSLDFYFPEYKSAIEYQGRQHFSDISLYYAKEKESIIERDLRKIQLCKENGVKLYHMTKEYHYLPKDFNLYKMYTSLDDILQEMHCI